MSLKSILLVDDNDGEQFLYKSIISSYDEGIEVISAYDGKEAIEILQSLQQEGTDKLPDCILLDVNMPRMDGFSFLDEYSQIFSNASTVVIMFTSSINKADKDKALAYDCVSDYFTKPLSEQNLDHLKDLVS